MKTVNLDDFALQKKVRAARLGVVKDRGQEIHRLLKDTNKKLKVSQGLPDWKAYVDFVNNIVVYGLVGAMAFSLNAMSLQLNEHHLVANSLPPLLEIQLDLIDKKIVFLPEVGLIENVDPSNRSKHTGIMNITAMLVNAMLGLSSCFKRLDTAEGSYAAELTEAPEVRAARTKVTRLLKENRKKCQQASRDNAQVREPMVV